MPLFGTFQLTVLFCFSSDIARNWLNISHHYNSPHHFIQFDDVTITKQQSDENPLEYINDNNDNNDNNENEDEN